MELSEKLSLGMLMLTVCHRNTAMPYLAMLSSLMGEWFRGDRVNRNLSPCWPQRLSMSPLHTPWRKSYGSAASLANSSAHSHIRLFFIPTTSLLSRWRRMAIIMPGRNTLTLGIISFVLLSIKVPFTYFIAQLETWSQILWPKPFLLLKLNILPLSLDSTLFEGECWIPNIA